MEVDNARRTRFLLGGLLSFAVGVWTYYLLFESWDLIGSGLAGAIGVALYGLQELLSSDVEDQAQATDEEDDNDVD